MILFKPLVLDIGILNLSAYGVFWVGGTVLFLFFLWRNLRRDYREEDLIELSLLAVLSFLIGGRLVWGITHLAEWGTNVFLWLAFWFQAGFSFGGGAAFLLATVFYWTHQKKLNILFALENLTRPALLAMIGITIGTFLGSGETKPLLDEAVLLITYIASFPLSRYRSFSWYGSGKPGFLFLMAVIIFLGLKLILDFAVGPVLYLNSVLTVSMLVIAIIWLLALSRSK